jgi:hypothetical protein
LEPDHFYHVREGDSNASPVELKRIHFDLTQNPAQSHAMKMAMPATP